MTNRIERIESMLVDEPNDTFLRYSLAMEYFKIGRHTESLEKLENLTKENPPYVPAFFMAAQHLVELDDVNQAREFLRTGIDAARCEGDSHAAAEMSEFLSTLGEYGE